MGFFTFNTGEYYNGALNMGISADNPCSAIVVNDELYLTYRNALAKKLDSNFNATPLGGLPLGKQFKQIINFNNRLIAVGHTSGSAATMAYSDNFGITWNACVTPVLGNTEFQLITNGSVVCALNYSMNAGTYYSNDGITFVAGSIGNGALGLVANSINGERGIWSESRNLFLALTTTNINSSPDGINWTAVAHNIPSGNGNSIFEFEGDLYYGNDRGTVYRVNDGSLSTYAQTITLPLNATTTTEAVANSQIATTATFNGELYVATNFLGAYNIDAGFVPEQIPVPYIGAFTTSINAPFVQFNGVLYQFYKAGLIKIAG